MSEEGVFPMGSDSHESVFRSMTESEVSLDEMLSLACRQGKQDIVELLLESGANVNHRNKAGNTPLLEACSQGHVSIARLLLDRSADIDAPTETTYDSALTWACTLGNVEIVRLLLDRKAKVEHRTKDGCTALMFAALAGHEKVAKLLLDHCAEINVESDSNKDSPLTFACWKGHQKVVELFLDRNADIEHRTKEGFSPLMFAALGGHTEVAALLLKHHAEVNNPSGSNNDIPLTSACWKGHHQVVALLLQHDSDIEHRTKDGCTPLMLAAREGHLSVAQLLLEHGAKVNMPSGSENNIPLTLACWKGHRDVVSLLLRNVSNIEHQNKAGCTPLMLAAREGHQEATRLLLDSGAQINVPSGSNDDTPLTLACWKGHEDVVSLLIERNSNVNHQTKTGCTPLMEATREGHVGVARLLLEAGADVETPDNYGQSPFFMACWKGHADVATLLLEYEANKDCRTKTGITPLFQACRENHVDVVKLLLDYGCNPSSPFPNSRECPLTLAAEKGYTDLTQLLLSRSACVETRTKKGCSPLYLACREGHKEIAIMLSKKGASTEAVDQRGTTPLLAAYKNGHIEVVEWLLAHVAHLPSDPECNKALLAPMPTDIDLAPQRTKCIELIMKAKNTREEKALANAKTLCKELDAEREKKESRRKAAAKKRDKRKKKKQAEKMDAREVVDKEEGVAFPMAVVGREEEEEGEDPNTIPQPLPSSENEVPCEISAMDAPLADGKHLQKTRLVRGKRPGKQSSPRASVPLSVEEGSDSGDEYHDALPEFSLTGLPMHPNNDKSPRSLSPPPPPSPASRLSPTTTSSSLQDDRKIAHSLLSSHTDMSTTRYRGQNNKRSPQPKAEVSPFPLSSVHTSRVSTGTGTGVARGSSRGTGSNSSVEQNRNDLIRGNQGAGFESSSGSNGTDSRKRAPQGPKTPNRKVLDKEGSGLTISTSNQRLHLRDLGWTKMASPSGALPVATRGVVSSGASTSNSSSVAVTSQTNSGSGGEMPASQSRPVKGKSSVNNKQQPPSSGSRSHRSNHASLEPSRKHVPDSPPPPSSSTTYHSTLDHTLHPSAPMDAQPSSTSSSPSSWSKHTLYSSTQNQKLDPPTVISDHDHDDRHSPSPYDVKADFVWTSSQESVSSDWGDDAELESQLLWAQSTDDDKIRSQQQLKAAVAAQHHQQQQPSMSLCRPAATTAFPTPTFGTSGSTTTTPIWQEVTRTTRTVQLTVLNSLVGRIIGRGGSKINSIQVASGAHINVSRNIPKSTERLITIKGTQRSISKAQELIDEALSTPDNTLEVCAPSPDGGTKIVSSLPTSPALLHNPPDPPLSCSSTSRAPTHPRHTKRYTSALTSTKDSHTTAAITTTSSEGCRFTFKRPLPSTKETFKHVATTTSTGGISESYTNIVSRSTTWTTSSNTFASVAAATSSSTSSSTSVTTSTLSPATHASLANLQEELQVATSKNAETTSPSPLSSDGSEKGQEPCMLSSMQASTASSSKEDGALRSESKDVIDMNTEFPPLSTSVLPSQHQRHPDPPGISTPMLDGRTECTNLIEDESVVSSTREVGSSTAVLAEVATTPSPSERNLTSSASEKLLFDSSITTKEKEEDEGGGGVKGAVSVTLLLDNEEGVASSLAAATCPFKVAKPVPVISQSNLPPSTLPATTVLPPACQSNSSPDLTAIHTPPSRGGNYGAIGPPTRRSSLPSVSPGVPSRKISYGGRGSFLSTLENVHENDPLSSAPGGMATPPLSSASCTSAWPNERRGRSNSLTGHHSHLPHNGPLPPRAMSFKAPCMSVPSQLHIQSDDPVMPHGTPDTPHGEIHPMNEQDFTTPSGVYGAIGSNMPNITGVSNSHLTRSLPSSMGVGLSYTNSPLSSPCLPHPPSVPCPNMKVHPSSDIWVPQFGSGPRTTTHHPMSQVVPPPPGPSFGFPPPSFPPPLCPPQHHNHIQHHQHHLQHTASFPHILPPGGHKHLSEPHLVPRVTMGDHQHHSDAVGGIFIPNMGIRHSFGGDDYRIGNGNPSVQHKRWSVPSYTHIPQPAVSTHFSAHQVQRSTGEQPHLPPPPPGRVGGGVWSKPPPSSLQGMETRSLGGGGPSVNGQTSSFDHNLTNKMYGQTGGGGGGILSINDPWAQHWAAPSGGPGFSSSPPLSQANGPVHLSGSQGDGGGEKGSSNISDPSWTSSVAPGGGEEELEGNSPESSDGGMELFQLMKSLDINSEHMQSLKARKLSLQQLHSMSEEEWKSLKLPVGPRVKLMNAISNIRRKGSDGQQEVADVSGISSPSSPSPSAVTASDSVLTV